MDQATIDTAGSIAVYVLSIIGMALLKVLLFGFLGTVVGIILAIILGRKGVFKREYKVWNIISKLNYPAVVFLFIYIFCSYAAVSSIQNSVEDDLKEYITPIVAYSQEQFPSFKEFLANNRDLFKGDDFKLEAFLDDYLVQYYYIPESNGFWEQKKATVINFSTQVAGKWIIKSFITAVISNSLGKPLEEINIKEDDIKEGLELILVTDLTKVDKNIVEVFALALKQIIKTIFNGFYMSIFTPFLLGFLIIALDFFIHKGVVYYKKRPQSSLKEL
ncbi:MAG: hypothetical protein GY754_01425 [bacterium]|nr:hypothetical protein [bacterium]